MSTAITDLAASVVEAACASQTMIVTVVSGTAGSLATPIADTPHAGDVLLGVWLPMPIGLDSLLGLCGSQFQSERRDLARPCQLFVPPSGLQPHRAIRTADQNRRPIPPWLGVERAIELRRFARASRHDSPHKYVLRSRKGPCLGSRTSFVVARDAVNRLEIAR
jgi:hypothetical protein